MSDKRYAKDEKCIDCGDQAVTFFPVFDPDIPSYPYCQECLDKARMRLAKEIMKINKDYEKKH